LELIETFFIALALGMDAFAVGLGVGARWRAPRQVFRLSYHFGLFQFLMPLLGWFLGRRFLAVVQSWGVWLAAGLLVFIGGRMIYEALQTDRDRSSAADPTRGLSLVALSLATSIDALGVGFSLGLIGGELFRSAAIIGIVAGLMTWSAMILGQRLSRRFGRRLEVLGGLILLAIAVKLVI